MLHQTAVHSARDKNRSIVRVTGTPVKNFSHLCLKKKALLSVMKILNVFKLIVKQSIPFLSLASTFYVNPSNLFNVFHFLFTTGGVEEKA